MQDLRRNVEDDIGGHAQVDAPEVLVDAEHVVIVPVSGLGIQHRNSRILVDDTDGRQDPRPHPSEMRRPTLSPIEAFGWVECVPQVPQSYLVCDEALSMPYEVRARGGKFDQHPRGNCCRPLPPRASPAVTPGSYRLTDSTGILAAMYPFWNPGRATCAPSASVPVYASVR